MPSRAIVVVTGATNGIGFGICHRLIDQLCYPIPPDLLASTTTTVGEEQEHFFPCSALTLVLPCRSLERGEKTRIRLLDAARACLRQVHSSAEGNRHAERFVSELSIDVLYCDLASINSILEFGRVVCQRYPYVTHIINNAGTGSFLGIHMWKGFCELFKDPVRAVTAPNYKIEVKGEKSKDGLGWVWQCNVFGHYVIYRSLLPLLQKSPFQTSRVLWMSSLEALRDNFDPADWQLTETEMPYEGSKCQMDLVSVTLDRSCVTSVSGTGCTVRHLVIQPGVANTDILGASQIGWLMNFLKLVSFYLARLLFSENHTITPYAAAVSAVLASLIRQVPNGDRGEDEDGFEPVKYSSKTDWAGRPFVTRDKVDVWPGNEKAGVKLVEQMSTLYDDFAKGRRTK